MHQKARVEGEGCSVVLGHADRVCVAARARVALKDVHVMGARQHMGSAQAGDPGTDDCEFHTMQASVR